MITSPEEFLKYKNGLDEATARKLFEQGLDFYVKKVNQYLRADITQNEFDALVMLAFNIGVGNPKSRRHIGLYFSSVLKIINGESTGDIDKAWIAYSNSQGHFMRGLLNRRRSELNVFHNGVYIKL